MLLVGDVEQLEPPLLSLRRRRAQPTVEEALGAIAVAPARARAVVIAFDSNQGVLALLFN